VDVGLRLNPTYPLTYSLHQVLVNHNPPPHLHHPQILFQIWDISPSLSLSPPLLQVGRRPDAARRAQRAARSGQRAPSARPGAARAGQAAARAAAAAGWGGRVVAGRVENRWVGFPLFLCSKFHLLEIPKFDLLVEWKILPLSYSCYYPLKF